MTDYCIALDIGTSGLRCQALEMDTGKTVATSITQKHPIPGMNVIDHVNFAMKSGQDLTHTIIITSIKDLIKSLNIDLNNVKRMAVCGNPFQLSLFQNIEIRDLAYAGKNKLKDLGVVSPSRDGIELTAIELGLDCIPNATVLIPPAVRHEIGADAMAMLLITDVLNEKEPCIVVDYGTNAEMALIANGNIITGSAAAGPALEGQQIKEGMLAAPGAIADINITDKGWKCTVLDESMLNQEGDTVDPLTGKLIEEGKMHGKAVGITGTGVVAALACGLDQDYIHLSKIESPSGFLFAQDDVIIGSPDVDEAGKAIGALRAGFLTLLNEAGLWTGDVKKAYMSGASGLYVDAKKALKIGMVVPGATHLVQFGNTSIELARRLAMGQTSIEELREFAKKLRATHCMFATAQAFKDIYSVEYSLWCGGMPASEYNNMIGIYGFEPISEPIDDPVVERISKTDLPDTEKGEITILKDTGITLSGVIEGCILCGLCVKECPEKALEISPDGDICTGHIHSDRCAGTACRRCERKCKRKILHVGEFQPDFDYKWA